MDDEKQKAFAHFDAIKSSVEELHALAAQAEDQQMIDAVNDHHAALHRGWTDYLVARGWEGEALTAQRSGGEDKPPQTTKPEA